MRTERWSATMVAGIELPGIVLYFFFFFFGFGKMEEGRSKVVRTRREQEKTDGSGTKLVGRNGSWVMFLRWNFLP